jgi:hypothetical protein
MPRRRRTGRARRSLPFRLQAVVIHSTTRGRAARTRCQVYGRGPRKILRTEKTYAETTHAVVLTPIAWQFPGASRQTYARA